MSHTLATTGCKGWMPGPYSTRDSCRVCYTTKNPATVRDPQWQPIREVPPAIVAPSIRPPCIHLGEVQSGCPLGDRLRDVRHCLCEATEAARCWRSELKNTDTDIASCERCPFYAVPKLDLAPLFGGVPFRVACIALERRPDRWKRFAAECRIANVERSAGIDGKYADVPRWWSAGRGAYGCHESHRRLLMEAIAAGYHESNGVLLVLEDDAFCEANFAERMKRFMAAVPSDWQQVYLGGEHLGRRRPWAVNGEVMRAQNVNRAHAYAVRGAFIKTLYDHLVGMTARKDFPHHVDHRMGVLHPGIKCYVPTRWLIGQRGGTSDIGKSYMMDRFWR